MDSERYWVEAQECTHKEVKELQKAMQILGFETDFFLGYINLNDKSDFVWCCLNNQDDFSMIPAFFDGDLSSVSDCKFEIARINLGEIFLRGGNLYRYDENFNIQRLRVIWSAEIAKVKAAFSEFKAEDCWLYKCYTIGKNSKFISVAWWLENEQSVLLIPVFPDEKLVDPDTGYNLDIREMDYQYIQSGNSFFHKGCLWKVSENEFGQIITQTTLSVI